ncbi:hypothetical protein JXA80_06350, partial [bacterium]|nr:hypothetical protein [candidate division CSSED10-310 bacterium]
RQRRINRAYYLGWRYWLGHGTAFEDGYVDRVAAVDTAAVNKLMKTLPLADDWFWAVTAVEDVR